jgi:adenosine deaminase
MNKDTTKPIRKNHLSEKDILSLNKGELHVHLNGLISKKTIREIIDNEKSFNSEDINIDSYFTPVKPYKSLEDYIRIWDVLRLIPKCRANLKIMMEDAFHNLKKDHINFAEIRNSVIYISLLNDITVTKALEWITEELETYSKKYNIKAGLILTVPRGDYCIDNFMALLKAYKGLGCPSSVVGLDLAGNENYQCPKELGNLFRAAKEKYNLKITIHAGETGNPNNIEEAIISYGADRIGHGTSAVNDMKIIELLKKKNICVEVCPISNHLTGAIRGKKKHPILDFIENEVPFVICSDNPQLHDASLSKDYILFTKIVDDISYVLNMFAIQQKYTFIKDIL